MTAGRRDGRRRTVRRRVWPPVAELGAYAATVGLLATVLVGAAVVPLGAGWIGLKTGLFLVGWLAFGTVSIRLVAAGRPGTVGVDSETGRTQRSPTDRLLARVPPLRWHWDGHLRPATPLLARQFVGALAILALSAALEFGAGVGA